MNVKNQWVGDLLLGHDEGDAGAVRPQGRTLLSGAAVEHRQRGQRRRTAAVSSHVPQLIAVPVDGVVVVQLDPAGAEPHTQDVCSVFYRGPEGLMRKP